MNKKTSEHQRYEMRNSWNSYRWLLKEKLISMDNMTRSMTSEMTTVGVPKDIREAFIQEEFTKLWNEVINEQRERYKKEKTRKKRKEG